MTATLDTRPAPALSPAALVALLRDLVPCPSADPLARDRYEQALREWAARRPWERDVEGFAAFVGGELSTLF